MSAHQQSHTTAPEPGGGIGVSGPLGDWVVVPDGRVGQVWAKHFKEGRWWVAFGTPATAGDHYLASELKPAGTHAGTIDHGQELPL